MAKTPAVAGAIPDTPKTPKATKASHELDRRLRFPTTKDGKRIAWAKLPPEKREALRDLMSDPEIPAQLGIAAPAVASSSAPGAAVEKFPPELCGVIFDALSMVLINITSRHYPADRAQAIALTPAQKKELNPQAAHLIDKHWPGGLNKWGEEAAFGVALVTALAGNLAIVRAAAAAPPAPAAQAGPVLVPNTDFSPAVNH